jgi:hypothetical protein
MTVGILRKKFVRFSRKTVRVSEKSSGFLFFKPNFRF